MLSGKKIIIGVSGGIAAYKSAALVSALKQSGADVQVLMTENAEKFVGRITFEALSGHRVITDTFDSEEYIIPHIAVAKTADIFMVAPATADIIAKLANGIADDMLTSCFIASDCPKVIVPAMNVKMYENPATRENIEKLKRHGITVLDPDEGHLAEGISAKGKMPEPSVLYRYIEYLVSYGKDLVGKKVVITAGPTRESLDPVRFITNRSTGKMGYALAKVAAARGAETVLISGHVNELSDGVNNAVLTGTGASDGVITPVGVRRIDVESAEDMFKAVKAEYKDADCVIMAAAVADFRPLAAAKDKIKKDELPEEEDEKGRKQYILSLERTEDILLWLGKHKKKAQKLVGFSMETRDLIENSEKKLTKKNADMIIANDLNTRGAGFGTDTNVITIIKEDSITELPIMTKEEAAAEILDEVFG